MDEWAPESMVGYGTVEDPIQVEVEDFVMDNDIEQSADEAKQEDQ